MLRRALSIAAAVIAALVALGAAAFFGAAWIGERKLARTLEIRVVPVPFASPRDAVALRLGRYLFESRGCAECHGADGAGRVIADGSGGGPYIRSPDITPAPGSAVAAYAEADWVRAIRHGVDPAGRALLIMPSQDYNRMNDGDFAALVAYARSLAPGPGTRGEVRLPAMLKALYAVGVFHDASENIDHRLPPSAPVPVAVSAAHGAYVANVCIGCHGPRYSGGSIPGAPPEWPPASNLTPGEGSVMGRYGEVDAFVAMMRTGKRPDGSAVNPAMPFESLRNLNDTDLRAIHAFLKTVAPRRAGER